LRERKDDIPLLIEHFRARANREHGRAVSAVTDEVRDYLVAYPWPGNIRELENLVDRLVILKGEGTVGIEDLPSKFKSVQSSAGARDLSIPPTGVDFNELVGDFENHLIHQAMRMAQGNKNQAARLLGLNRTTLVEKIKKKQLDF
ncbi:MAG: sigma-54-dependent Fis family transcriptional regulator, partial [Myxococcales bacterium]|nr:sigma-54-dependent Fis family transcriptional regulator [Myxococcales bacterium]